MTTIESRVIAIAEHLPPAQRDELATLLKSVVATAVMSVLIQMDESGVDPADLLDDDELAAEFMNACADIAMGCDVLPGRISLSGFIRAGRMGDA